MKKKIVRIFAATILLAGVGSALAEVHYVDLNSTNATPPYTNWTTAATNIQDAVDAAVAGDEIVVADGTYASGGDEVYGQVVVYKPLIVRSVNGPQATVILGGVGRARYRCVYLTSGASLSGFTLAQGEATNGGGGLFCESVTAVVSNCVVSGNSGGALGGTLNNCTLTANFGDGAAYSTLNNCTLTSNSGTGASHSTLNNCALTDNSGSGASSSSLTNCTLTGNSADGASGCTLNNCIVYFNGGTNYDSSSTLYYCCTTPQPTNGIGNISSDPQLASAWHLSAVSPCRGAGGAAYAIGTDIDGEAWLNPPSIGCDEYRTGAVMGPLNVAIAASYTSAPMGFTVQLSAFIEGRTTGSVWDFGDGIAVSNQPYSSHAWTALGDYAVVLRAFNESQPGGISATVTVHVVTGVHYVAAGSVNPVAPYASWATAATNIQDAINGAVEPGAQVLVTNGVYAPIIAYNLTVRSVNGPLFTVINGGQSRQCVYLFPNGTLSGFTLTNGLGYNYDNYGNGGGANGGTLTNCTLSGNSAPNGGGGAANCTLNNCTLTDNSAGYGGGAANCTLNNCTLTGNSASFGGGVYSSILNNCIVYFNTTLDPGQQWANYDPYSILNYSCTTPQPTNGVGNISLDPQLASSSHLSAFSPCRAAGNAAYTSGTDIDGEAWASPPSIGCDQYQAGAVTGPLSVGIAASFTKVAIGYQVQLTALTEGRTTGSDWDFGDGAVATNHPQASHAWVAPGDYAVVLRAYNESQPGGISSTVTVHVVTGVHFVAADSANPVAPYASWATAATIIQDAINAAVEPGAQVLVTDGTYAVGAPATAGDGTMNRVVVDKPLAVRSVNGPLFTIISGGGSNRCVYLANGGSLSGFTLTNGYAYYQGYAQPGSGVYGGTLTNCTLSGNSSDYGGGGAYISTLINCTLSGNSASSGGGASSCTLNTCTLTGNSAFYAGGAVVNCTLNNCTLSGNSALLNGNNGGGAAFYCTLNNCTLSSNSAARFGGGAYGCTMNNCTLTRNSADSGGGAYGGTLNNCTLSGNSAGRIGGGAYNSALNNCTLTGNSATLGGGGGASGGTLNNCIAYFNTARLGGANYDAFSSLNYCCTTPQPATGVGNISLDPRLASASHLSALSPCRGAGNAAYASGTDIDGEGWANPPSIGCDEYHADAVTGALNVAVSATFTNVAVGYPLEFRALIEGRTAASIWDFGDGTMATNQPSTSHAWAVPGDYALVLRVYNENQPGGMIATVTVHVVPQPIGFVAAGSANPVAPYTSWATAATNIQDAVDATTVAGALVLVTNGIYSAGGRTVYGSVTYRVMLDKPLALRSVNGPQFTTIAGGWQIRCAYLTNGASLSGFTLTEGDAYSGGADDSDSGGGAYGGALTNCTLTGNRAPYGGGASACTLNNCTLTGNSACLGVAYYCTLNNCTLTGNSALSCASSGGAARCELNNSIIYFNNGNYDYFSTLSHCCTTPDPGGLGNITNAPLFVDQASGNLRLQSNSPCINAGLNALAPTSPDLEGNLRIVGGTVDIGAYEYQSPASRISFAWLQQFDLPVDPLTDSADPDGDGVSNYREWLAGSDPTNPFSSPARLTITPSDTSVVLTWSTNAIGFTLQYTTNLGLPALWSTNSPAPVVIAGQNTVTNPITGAQQFYRLVH